MHITVLQDLCPCEMSHNKRSNQFSVSFNIVTCSLSNAVRVFVKLLGVWRQACNAEVDSAKSCKENNLNSFPNLADKRLFVNDDVRFNCGKQNCGKQNASQQMTELFSCLNYICTLLSSTAHVGTCYYTCPELYPVFWKQWFLMM
jgi:hypothetical protein